ncbi:MAG TPA: TetR/AcrR family transcriptional regulator [Blastocatellia bacterium]|nr:TetR/AcrR family transcriptional regulator [Blastocatellia bacterium]
MPTKSKKPDRRSSKTRQSLHESLRELILEKRYDSITVQEVIDRADVGRATFYAHFRDKDDLFLSDWEQFLDHFAQAINFKNVSSGRFVPMREFFQHLQEVHNFYLALCRSRKTDLIFKIGLDYLAKGIEKKLAAVLPAPAQSSVPVPVLAHYLSNEVFGNLRWWLDHNMPYTPERMDEIFHEIVRPTFKSALNGIQLS